MGSTDETKGRVKEAAGVLSDDENLKREGRIDQAAGKATKLIDGAADKLKSVLARRND